MIQIQNVTVEFPQGSGTIRACDNVSLAIEQGDIFGIVGYSGAGKSTLVRCINRLQKPMAGSIHVKGTDVTALSEKALREERKNIGMIFQHFNLMNARTVFDNVYYPIRRLNIPKEEKQKRVRDLLALVGISEKERAYPRSLSGGQKQRVAIARALATEPDILLCDEATSALDPNTTRSILQLLQELNEKLKLTIVIITHEMLVVKDICNKCAVMQEGKVIESGHVIDIFHRPQQPLTKEFIDTALHRKETVEKLKEGFPKDKDLYFLQFVGASTHKPFMVELYKRFQVETNVLFGNVEYIHGIPLGNLIVAFDGTQDDMKHAFQYLKENAIDVEVA